MMKERYPVILNLLCMSSTTTKQRQQVSFTYCMYDIKRKLCIR